MKPINFVLSQFPSLFKHGANDGVLISQDNFLFSFCFVFVPPKHEKLKRYQTSTSISCGGERNTSRNFLGKAITVENMEVRFRILIYIYLNLYQFE